MNQAKMMKQDGNANKNIMTLRYLSSFQRLFGNNRLDLKTPYIWDLYKFHHIFQPTVCRKIILIASLRDLEFDKNEVLIDALSDKVQTQLDDIKRISNFGFNLVF